MELGRATLKERDVADLLALYGVNDPAERETTLALLRESHASGWWQRFVDPLPGWMDPPRSLGRYRRSLSVCEGGMPKRAL